MTGFTWRGVDFYCDEYPGDRPCWRSDQYADWQFRSARVDVAPEGFHATIEVWPTEFPCPEAQGLAGSPIEALEAALAKVLAKAHSDIAWAASTEASS